MREFVFKYSTPAFPGTKKEKELGKNQCSGNEAEVELTTPFFLILRLIIGLKVTGQGRDK